LLAAAAREPRLNATFIVEGAKAELHARRYDRARSLLVGQPWLEDYAGGEALAVLAEAEARLGLAPSAGHYAAAGARATGVPRARPWSRRVARSTSRGWPGPWATRVVRATPCTRSWRGRPSRTTPRPQSASRSPGWRRARLRSMSRSRAR